MPLVPTPLRLKLEHACDQWHSSQTSTASFIKNTYQLALQFPSKHNSFKHGEAIIAADSWRGPYRLIASDSDSRYGARFWQKSTLGDAIGSHVCSLEALACAIDPIPLRVFTPLTGVINSIPLGSSLSLAVPTLNCVETLQVGGVHGKCGRSLHVD
jgi:hypothetical protein